MPAHRPRHLADDADPDAIFTKDRSAPSTSTVLTKNRRNGQLIGGHSAKEPQNGSNPTGTTAQTQVEQPKVLPHFARVCSTLT